MMKKEDRLDPKAESALGRLSLARVITPAQYDAGAMYVKIVGEWRSVIGSPKATAGSGRGSECWIASSSGACLVVDCPCERKQKRYTRAFRLLTDTGREALMAVNRVAVHGEEIGEEEIANLVLGLDALAKHFGLTDERKSTHSSNANSVHTPGA